MIKIQIIQSKVNFCEMSARFSAIQTANHELTLLIQSTHLKCHRD